VSLILVNAEAGRIPLPAGVVHCHCTSPPYWRQRDYSSKKDEEGDTQRRYWPAVSYRPGPGLPEITVRDGVFALGMEPTPELFIAHLVLVYREVYRVTRSDSAGWNVIGDCYWDSNRRRATRNERALQRGEEDGQLVGIPAMLMKALQADGWLVRNDCVWAKKSPMPESLAGTRWERCRVKVKTQDNNTRGGPHRGYVAHGATINDSIRAQYTDCPGCPRCEPHGGYVLRRGSWRHTRAQEVVLHLTKGMNYWSDQEAVREIGSKNSHGGQPIEGGPKQEFLGQQVGGNMGIPAAQSGRNPRSVLIDGQPVDFTVWLAREYGAEFADEMMRRLLTQMGNPPSTLMPKPSSYSGQHYATYPPDLIRPLIKSSCPTRCCPACGSGWAPQVERESPSNWQERKQLYGAIGGGMHRGRRQQVGKGWSHDLDPPKNNVLAYLPTCACHAGEADPPHVPGLVLDPFLGSGTTLLEARRQGLDGVGLDLSYDYLHDQARERLGLAAWDAWHRGRDGRGGESLEKLPMFKGIT
jgi:DNA modification methylase